MLTVTVNECSMKTCLQSQTTVNKSNVKNIKSPTTVNKCNMKCINSHRQQQTNVTNKINRDKYANLGPATYLKINKINKKQ